jgi:hypothetical protein
MTVGARCICTALYIATSHNDVSMLAWWKILMEVYVWVISIVQEEQPPLVLSRKPEKSIFSSLPNTLFLSNGFKARLHNSLTTCIKIIDFPKTKHEKVNPKITDLGELPHH